MSFVKDNLLDKIPLITTAVLSRPQSTILLCKEVEWTTLASPFIKLYKLHTNATSFCTIYNGLKLFFKEHLFVCLLTNMAAFCDHYSGVGYNANILVFRIAVSLDIPYMRHQKPLLIRNHSRILIIDKVWIIRKKNSLKTNKWTSKME